MIFQMQSTLKIIEYSPEYRSSTRKILEKIGWAEHYISPAKQNIHTLSQDKKNHGAYLAIVDRVTYPVLHESA